MSTHLMSSVFAIFLPAVFLPAPLPPVGVGGEPPAGTGLKEEERTSTAGGRVTEVVGDAAADWGEEGAGAGMAGG